MKGTHGRILFIDVTERSFTIEPLGDAGLPLPGGKALATRLLLEHNPAGVDPLSPDNRLVIATGPCCGTSAWGGSRYGVFSKSPQTGFYAESYSGGKTPEAIDRAGFDAVVISGGARTLTALAVHPDGCDFHEVPHLAGAETYAAEDALLADYAPEGEGYGRPGAMVIGPAGEKLVAFSVIENDYWRSAGRCGLGAVLGSKKIKGLVFAGDRKREAADPEGLKRFAAAFLKANIDSPATKAYRARGTTQMVALMNTVGAFPSRYWSAGTCDHWERISGDTFHEQHDVTPHACLKCFMACGRKARIKSGPHKGLTIEGPEYETIYSFGGLCMVRNIDEIAHLNDLCDRLGLDTISAGNVCALVAEAASQGRLDAPVTYGDADTISALLEQIAGRDGLGDVLADGILRGAERLGLSDMAVHVKGMEPAGYDPRVLKGMGLTYGTSPRGACHLRTTFYKAELSGMIPSDAIEGKADLLINFEDRLVIFDCLILCRFYRDMYDWATLSELLTLVTGESWDEPSLRRAASLVVDDTRRFNVREGLTPDDDLLPRKLHEALPSGHVITREEYALLLNDYYRLRGWDESGVPRSESGRQPGGKI
ncbi:aldehyde ferredoxin oxidoreductase family protein [Pseudodesulfovibrio indicus]|uniref:Aldehyde:ferredoxin oxidoreductase n=1 Tax=Pseudodesulfovibrio indicus TaxID=1716143 RepID=A0A126QML8_9BACT|nr:aldehyde ferredoxin oxidoreductase family protein [Pseudodesulfovibrio indicus]AMK11202.1 aldehyde:ferredoxin oxidoreductase [Pseudodesulfovibrio indicus]TDT92227.1 aldehyde:ferredoxin oxidoreductase [Pseudodesulfovibrio indicus]